MTHDTELAVVMGAADIGRGRILSATGEGLDRLMKAEKSHQDYVTEIDFLVEQDVRLLIGQSFPDDVIVGEEFAASGTDESRRWYLDPVDGTNNLVNGSLNVGFSIALYEDDLPVVGAIDLPFRDLRVTFAKGKAYVNGERLKRSDVPLDFVGLPGNFETAEPEALASFVSSLGQIRRLAGVRISGALTTDLVDVALGHLGARVSFAPKPVDVAAGLPICLATGAVALGLTGKPWSLGSGALLVANDPELADMLLVVLRRAVAR